MCQDGVCPWQKKGAPLSSLSMSSSANSGDSVWSHPDSSHSTSIRQGGTFSGQACLLTIFAIRAFSRTIRYSARTLFSSLSLVVYSQVGILCPDVHEAMTIEESGMMDQIWPSEKQVIGEPFRFGPKWRRIDPTDFFIRTLNMPL
jgi:hypothetical protein